MKTLIKVVVIIAIVSLVIGIFAPIVYTVVSLATPAAAPEVKPVPTVGSGSVLKLPDSKPVTSPK